MALSWSDDGGIEGAPETLREKSTPAVHHVGVRPTPHDLARLRHPARGRPPAVAALAAVALALACGPRAAAPSGGGALPPAVADYAGLRWVPADATYVVATRRGEDALALLRGAFDGLGMLADVDAAELGRASRQELGFDLLSADDHAAMGVDLQRGIAVWSQGLGPSLAVPLADPERMAGEVARRRGPGTVIQVGRLRDVDVHTWRPDREVALHWAIAGDWLLAHLEVVAEGEVDGAWFEGAWAARGGLAATPDLAAALDEGRRRLGELPPLVGLVRVPAILAHPRVVEPPACASTLGALGRLFVVAAADAAAVRAVMVAEVPGGIDGLRALARPAPAGWAKARAGAPLVAELGLDARAAAAALGPCLEEDLVAGLGLDQVRGGRVFVHAIDTSRLEGRGAATAELGDPRMLARALSEIPGIGFLSKVRAIGPHDITEVNAPGVPRFAYGQLGPTTVVAVGVAMDDLLVGGMVAAGDELARLELRPRAWPEATWDELLAFPVGRARTRAALIRRLRAWSRGELTLALEGRALVMSARGER